MRLGKFVAARFCKQCYVGMFIDTLSCFGECNLRSVNVSRRNWSDSGKDNAGHFFVGTQDKQLRIAISKVPAGASMFISVNGLHLEQPSSQQESVVNKVSA